MDATAPSSLAVPGGAAMTKGYESGRRGGQVDDRFAGSPVTTYKFSIDPKRANLLQIGSHTLDIPANAICNTKSGYGLETFDLDCKAEKAKVTITAILRETSDSIPRIDLFPHMRFDPEATVTLTMSVPALSRSSSPEWTILYCPTVTQMYCVDESVLDPSLATRANYRQHTLFRRIKHFSGYFVES